MSTIPRQVSFSLPPRPRLRTGLGCLEYLLAEEAALRAQSFGCDLPPAALLRALSQTSSGSTQSYSISTGIQMDSTVLTDGAIRVMCTVASDWKIEILLDPRRQSSTVSVFYSPPSSSPSFLLHDPPGKMPCRVVVTRLRSPQVDTAYIKSECHYSYGKRWDPRRGQPAETWYYADGVVERQVCYQQDRLASPSPLAPAFASFWEDGSPQVVEFGTIGRGRHRPPSSGPAYAEFFPNGVAALEIYSILNENDCTTALRWACRLADNTPRCLTEADRELIRSGDLSLLTDAPSRSPEKYSPTAAFHRRHGLPEDWLT